METQISNIKVSVIVPVYNTEKYLDRCLTSLCGQTLKEIEIICVNDGSTDNSLKILKQWAEKDSRIKVITQTNQKQGAARNRGIEIAKGEYLGFVDSDDWVDLDYFEKLYFAAVENDADMAMADFIRKNEKIHKIRLNLKEESIYTSDCWKFKVADIFNECCVTNKIFKSSKYKNLKFSEGVYYEDGPYAIESLHMANKLITVPNTYLYYFINKKSTVKSFNLKKLQYKISSRKKILNYLRSNNVQIKDESFWFRTFDIKIFSKSESLNTVKYCLFGFIPLFKHKIRREFY